jgi:hypothetical protein
VRVGIAHHLGWAVAVTASAGHEVVDRRRLELIEPGMPAAPVEYCQVLAECAHERGWQVHLYRARDVEAQAARILGGRAGDMLGRPRAVLGSPWTRDHRIALAATIAVR